MGSLKPIILVAFSAPIPSLVLVFNTNAHANPIGCVAEIVKGVAHVSGGSKAFAAGSGAIAARLCEAADPAGSKNFHTVAKRMTTRLLPPDEIQTRIDGFIIKRGSVDDDGPVEVPSAIARIIRANLPPLGDDGSSVADVYARMLWRHLKVCGRV